MPVSIRRQANGEIPPSSIPSICRYKCRSLPLSGIIIRMTSCFSSAIWISFPIIWNDYSRSYGLRLLPCLISASLPKDGTGHGEINSTCMISCAIWRKGCRRTIRCSSAMRTVSVCVRWSNCSATHGNTAPPCTMHPTDRTSA